MAHYAVGSFKPSRSCSPYQFVSTDLQPKGPFAKLDLKQLNIDRSQFDWVHHRYLFELEDCHSADQRVQYVTRLIASFREIRTTLHGALKSAEWEMVERYGRRRIQIVGTVLKTEYGYFLVHYDNGLRSNGQDESPAIYFGPCPKSAENPYTDVLATASVQGYLACVDPVEIKRAHDAGIAKADLGDLLREKHGR